MRKAAKKSPRSRTKAKTKTKTKTSKPPAEPSTTANGSEAPLQTGQLRIRMYRVGFGDFFLMTIPSAKDPSHMLHIVIDCGVTGGTTGKGDIGTIKEAVADMVAETGGELALIIMTHRHMDHIIGFSRCPEFQDFKGKVGAIWMPVWENEADAGISKFQNEMFALASELHASLALAADTVPDGRTILAMLQNAIGVAGAGRGGGSNAASLALLKNGLGVRPSYYCKGSPAELPQSLVDAGLTAEILGPPPADASQFMSLMDLRKGVGQYLDTAGNAGGGSSASGGNKQREHVLPFRKSWKVTPQDYPKDAFEEWEHRPLEGPKKPGYVEWKHLKQAVDAAQPAALMSAAKKVDNHLNNQSLVVLFTYGGKKLLFAGDAQAGNWEYWLYDAPERTTTPSDKLGKQASNVLGHLDFYKVGHHGSTNATPIAAVNAMNAGFVAMCSTQADTFGSVKNQGEVPRIPLIASLASKSALVRSDQIPVQTGAHEIVPVAHGTPPSLPRPKAGTLVRGPCYVDYLL